MRYSLIILGIFLFYGPLSARNNKLEGSVFDKLTGKNLEFAIIRLSNSVNGTSSNTEGCFEINLSPGKNTLIISDIGYNSDTILIDLQSSPPKINIYLDRSSIQNEKSSAKQILSAENIIKN